MGLLFHTFFMEEEKIRAFHIPEDEENIGKIARILGIGLVEFCEKPGMEAMKNGKRLRSEIFFQTEWDDKAEPAVWCRETLLETYLSFSAFPSAGKIWTEEERKAAVGFMTILGTVKSTVYLREGLVYALSHDPTLGAHNLPYGIFSINSLVNSGEIRNYAVFFFNVSSTGEMNNQIGRPKGSFVLRALCQKIEACLSQSEAVWRVGGDNFGALVLKKHIELVLAILSGSEIAYGESEEEKIHVSAVAGICLGDTEGVKTSDNLVDAALAAMNLARFVRHVPFQYYGEEVARKLEQFRFVESRFAEAMENGEYQTWYQPKVSLETREVIGAEALCRWVREGKVYEPASFIPALEMTKRICELDFLMLRQSCENLRAWMDSGYKAVEVSVNFSRKHLSNPRLASEILSVIDSFRIPHEMIIVEVTETTKASDLKALGDLVTELKKAGVRSSVDDFGTGYSSISMLRDIPFSELKIDRSLLTYSSDTRDRNIVMIKHVTSMASELGMTCIAEGVENSDQISMLRKMEIFRAQGFYFDKALPREVFEKRLLEEKYPELEEGKE